MDGIWVFIGAGGGIGALVGLAVMAPAILPRLFGGKKNVEPSRLRATVIAYAELNEKQRKRLQEHTSHFLKKVKMHADDGNLPPILATAIAGNACLLRLHSKADCYPALREIHVGGAATNVSAKRVDLNWSEVQSAMGGKRNPVVRAFAQILQETPGGSRTNNPGTDAPEKWQREFNAERATIDAAQSPVLVDYGQDSTEDFFLSACEAYFQQGTELLREHPRLYGLLHGYFGIHTAAGANPT